MTFNSSSPSFNDVIQSISCLLHIEKVVLNLLMTNSNCNFHGKFMGWFKFIVLLSAEISKSFLAWVHSRKILVVVYNQKQFDLVDELIISYLPLQFLQVVNKFFLVNTIRKRYSAISVDVLSFYRKWTQQFSLSFIEN